MSQVTESRHTIRERMLREAARQWGTDASGRGSSDPLVELLFGAFSVEMEKIRNEIAISRAASVQRLMETILPENLTGILPAHAVMYSRPAAGGDTTAHRTDQFVTPGKDGHYFTPSGSYPLTDATIEIIATGNRIDKFNPATLQRSAFLQPLSGAVVPPHTCWLGLPGTAIRKNLTLFFDWPAGSDALPAYLPAFLFETAPGKPVPCTLGLTTAEEAFVPPSLHEAEKSIREIYQNQFLTVHLDNLTESLVPRNYPPEWEKVLEPAEKVLFTQKCCWLRLTVPPAVPVQALQHLNILTNCFPVINRQLVHQRGRIQPICNVYGLTDTGNFLGMEKVLNGDGQELLPADRQDSRSAAGTYTLRNRNVARFDNRDAFTLLNEVTSRLRDDLAAFEALDNSILSSHIAQVHKSVRKLKDHLDTLDYELPMIYLTANTRAEGNILDTYFWSAPGADGNGIPPGTRLTEVARNSYKSESNQLVIASAGGRNPLNAEQQLQTFREALLTRGKAVTKEDFRTIALNMLSGTSATVQIEKKLDVSEKPKEGVRQLLELTIFPDAAVSLPEAYWQKSGYLVKKALEQRSTGVLPLFVKVNGFEWRI